MRKPVGGFLSSFLRRFWFSLTYKVVQCRARKFPKNAFYAFNLLYKGARPVGLMVIVIVIISFTNYSPNDPLLSA